MTSQPRTLLDYNGRPIAVGATVRQRNVYDRDGGALSANALQLGKVVAVGTARIEVDFGREAFHAFRGSGERARPIRIRAEYVELVADPPAQTEPVKPVMVADVTGPGRGLGSSGVADVDFLITREGAYWLVHEHVSDDPCARGRTLAEALRAFARLYGLTGTIELCWETRGDRKELITI